MALMFYDFEVFKHDWILVAINPIEKMEDVIVNNAGALFDLYEQYKSYIWVGYNSRHYDQFIFKSILLGFNPKSTSDHIINGGMNGNSIDKRFKTIKLYNYDVMQNMSGLKTLEGFMGESIHESSVDFNIDRKLTSEEIEETIKYCRHDVLQTIKVFMKTKSDFDAQMDLIKTFNLPMENIGLTKAQLTANILQCRKPFDERYDEFDLQIVETLKIEKYKEVVDWFKNRVNQNYSNNLKIDVAGIPHVFGWGGLHGCINEPVHRKGFLLHIDVTSYYPTLMIEYDFLTRNCRKKELFKDVYDKRVELKKAGKKKEQAPYKIVLNGTYGICKDKYSKAYDPRQANNVCVNGQLLLLDLIEKLEPYCELIQSNTDGLIIQIDEKDFDLIDDICFEWEKRTRMSLGFDNVTEIWQKDVNNYIFKFENGKLERKGAYVKELNDLDYDLPIINEAIVKFLTENIKPEDTINNCNELKKFQKIVKISSKYKFAYHNGERLNEKTFRVFASLDTRDSYIGKQKDYGATVEKFANTPANCFIDNSDINGKEVPLKLNKQWYIDLAIKRIEDYGFNASKYEQLELF
jgi:hypothetical protein